MKVALKIHPDRAGKLAPYLLEIYQKRGIFGHRELPDDAAKEVLEGISVEEALLFITLTTSLDYMRSASELWESSIRSFKDQEVKWVFNPHEVVKRGKEELKKALLKHKLAKKKERDVEIWHAISSTLSKSYGGRLTPLFEEYDYDVEKMFKDFLENRKKEFPSLSGTKLFPHWIRSLKDKLELPFKNLHKLPIPVDVHVARATFTTGCITGKYSSKGINETIKKRVIEVWKEGLKGTGIAPIELFRPLWLLSKYGCHYRRNGQRPKLEECPVKEFCVEGKVVVTSSKVEIDT
jgi:N-glycosylase/DNA lyase